MTSRTLSILAAEADAVAMGIARLIDAAPADVVPTLRQQHDYYLGLAAGWASEAAYQEARELADATPVPPAPSLAPRGRWRCFGAHLGRGQGVS